ncbi:MAG: hypothetical protein HGA78_01140, partial [Nitrospirales bacterium]|nr:hypothetical protein [Nitrospirales bacterium]
MPSASDNRLQLIIEGVARLDQALGQVKALTGELKGLGAGSGPARATEQAVTGIGSAATSSGKSVMTLGQLVETYIGYRAVKALEDATAAGLEFLSTIETASLGIASSFMANGQFIDQTTGKALQGSQALKAAQQDSKQIMEELQVANMQTIATLDQLVRAYQETLPVAMAKGFNREQVKEFTVGMVQAAGAIGLSLDMLGEETRSILTGAINPRTSRIATVLGLTNEDIAQFKGNAQGLFDFLMQKLSAFQVAGIESQTTWKGLVSNIKDIFLQVLGKVFDPLFITFKEGMRSIVDLLITVDEKTKTIKWNPAFLDGIEAIKTGFAVTIGTVMTLVEWIYRITSALFSVGAGALKILDLVPGIKSLVPQKGIDFLDQQRDIYDMASKDVATKRNTILDHIAGIESGGAIKSRYKTNPVKPDQESAKAAKHLAEEWARVSEELSQGMAKIGLDDYSRKQLELWNKFDEMQKKFGDKPLLQEWLKTMQGDEADRYMAEMQGKALAWENEMSRLFSDTEEGITEGQRTEVEKRLAEVDRWQEQLTDKMAELYANGLYSEQEYQDRLTEVARQADQKRLTATVQLNAQLIEAQASREIALAKMQEQRGEIAPQESIQRQVSATERILDAQTLILQDTTLEASQREHILQLVDELNDRLIGLHKEEERFTGTFFDGWAQGLKDLQKQAVTAFDQGREAAKSMMETFEQGITGALRNLRTGTQSWGDFFMGLLDRIMSKLEEMAVNNLLYGSSGQGSGGGLLGGIMGLVGSLFGGGGNAGGLSVADNWSVGVYGYPAYAQGGIAYGPSIFGESGPEAAVPLPDGRRIPVEL